MKVFYSPTFLRQLETLEPALQEEAIEKIEIFKNPANHRRLKVHKLKGPLAGRYSFSVNYRIRIVFSYVSGRKAVLLTAIGDHNIYK